MINIGRVTLSPRQWPKAGRGVAKEQLKKIRIKLMLLILFPLDLRTNLPKNVEIEMPPGEKFAVNYVCENSSTKN